MIYAKNNLNGNNMDEKRKKRKAFIRFLHAVPNEPEINVDIIVNGMVVASNVKYKDFTEYFGAKPGEYVVQVFPSASRLEQLLSIRIKLESEKIYTACIIGTVENISLEVFEDRPVADENESFAYMKFINISPSGEGFDVILDNVPIVYDIMFTEETDYIQISPGEHSLKINIYSNGRQVAAVPRMNLKAGNIYTCYIVGFTEERPFVEVLIPLEGSTYIDTSI